LELIKDILRHIRVDGSLFFHSELNAPWGLVLPASNEPKIHIALGGECMVQSTEMLKPVRLQHGDVILLPDGSEHWIADSVESPRVPAEQFCKSLEQGRPGFNATGPSVQLLCGLIRFDRTMVHPLISHLPGFIHIKYNSSKNATWLPGIIAQFESETSIDKPYSDVMVDRLFEVLFIQTIRNQVVLLDLPDCFWAALKDPKISKVLRLIHDRYPENISIEFLASEIYLSRSAFIDRFTRLVGESPISYLTAWRMQKSISLLRSNHHTIDVVAENVGYSSAESFSRAFKRHFNITPQYARQNESCPLSS